MLESVTPLRRETLQSQVHQKLCDLILKGELAPGESVTVSRIAKALDVSPMPVREAISRLMALGALTVVSGRSIGVPRITAEELDDLRRVRHEIEATAMRWAVASADRSCIERLSTIMNTMEETEAAGLVRDFIHANYVFHFAIYRQAGSPLLLDIISTIWLRINPQFHLLHKSGRSRISNLHHRKIFEAISSSDTESAVAALRADIDNAYEVIRASLNIEETVAERKDQR